MVLTLTNQLEKWVYCFLFWLWYKNKQIVQFNRIQFNQISIGGKTPVTVSLAEVHNCFPPERSSRPNQSDSPRILRRWRTHSQLTPASICRMRSDKLKRGLQISKKCSNLFKKDDRSFEDESNMFLKHNLSNVDK